MSQLYTEKYGQPQGNELVYGKDIIRRIDTFEFRLIDRFKSSRAAYMAYDQWMKENDEYNLANLIKMSIIKYTMMF
jgi:hypothetical protein